MPKAYSWDMRKRVIAEVENGASRREAAEEFEAVPCPIRLVAEGAKFYASLDNGSMALGSRSVIDAAIRSASGLTCGHGVGAARLTSRLA
jgi:hypothetical protein